MDLRENFRGHGFWLLKSEAFCESESSRQSRDLHEKSTVVSWNRNRQCGSDERGFIVVSKAWVALKLSSVIEEGFRRNDVGTENAVGVVDTGNEMYWRLSLSNKRWWCKYRTFKFLGEVFHTRRLESGTGYNKFEVCGRIIRIYAGAQRKLQPEE